MGRQDPQINIRLRPDRHEILCAAAYVNGATPSELARQRLEEALDRDAELPTVKKALEARAEQAAANEGKLAHLHANASRSQRTTDAKQ